MATQKLYAGAKLRETRMRLGLTQKAFADPIFADAAPPLADLRLTASNAPALAGAGLSGAAPRPPAEPRAPRLA